jgi:predicted ribosomally synthesized peptide with SipW-like signal peptide
MKRILGLTIAIILLLAAVIGGTLAYFSDTEVSGGNDFAVGTLDLKLTDANETDQDGVTASWGGTDMAPGDSSTGWVDLRNSGSLDADHVEVAFANTLTNVVTPAELGADDADVSDSLIVTVLTYDGADLLPAAIAAHDTGDGRLSLGELDGATIDDLTPVPTANGAAVRRLAMTVELDSATGNGNQGDSVTTAITFTLNQDASQ